MPFDKEKIAHRMKVLRSERHWSQEDLAMVSGVKLSAITKYETCENAPGIEAAVNIADAFEVPLDVLVGREVEAK